VAGSLVAAIVGVLEGAVVVGGLSAIGTGLYSLGIPKNSVIQYGTAIKTDQFLLVAHGTADEVAKARSILQATKPASLETHPGEKTMASA
jgi:hypothetical protein